MIEAEKMTTRKHLASIAKAMAQISFHGFVDGERSNLELIIQPFPKWTLEEADRLWCAAFVYYCCVKAGFEIPIRPDELREVRAEGSACEVLRRGRECQRHIARSGLL